MKRIIMFLIAVVMTAVISIKLPLINNSDSVTFYINGVVETDLAYSVIHSGGDSVVKCYNDKAKILLDSNEFDVQSVEIKSDKDLYDTMCFYNLKVSKTENVGEIQNYFGYSNQVNFRKIYIDDKDVNMQISVTPSGEILIGFPIIKTSY